MAANLSNNALQYTTARHFSVVYLIIIGMVGILSNLLVVIVFVKYERLRTAANLFILNLAVCDIILSSLDSALSIPSTYNNQWLFSRTACVCYGFLHYFFISITVSTLAAISIDRFFYITKPTQVQAWRITRARALGMLSVIYIYVLLFTFPPLTGWNSFVTEEYFYSGCYINYSDQDPAAIGYSVVASAFLFLAPLIIMIVCYHKIYRAVRSSTRKTIGRKLGPPGTPSTLRRKYPLFKRTHVQTAKMIVVVIFFCVIVWLPFVAVSLIKAFTGNSVVSPLGSHITLLITKSCVVYNVLIYVFLNRKLKAAITLLLCCGKTPTWMSNNNKTSISKMRLSRMQSETDREIPSDAVRNRLSALAVFTGREGNNSENSSDMPTPILKRKEVGIPNTGLSCSPPSSLKNWENKPSNSCDDSKLSSSLKVVVFVNSSVCGANELEKEPETKTSSLRSVSQIHSDASQTDILSFSALEDPKQAKNGNPHPGQLGSSSKSDVTKVEARRRAMRKMNKKEAGSRKLPTVPISGATKDTEIALNNNQSHHKITSPEIIVQHSREDSSSTVIPSSNYSTMSETSLNASTNDDSSIDVSPRTLYATAENKRHLPKKSKTIGYHSGRNVHASLKDRLKHSHKDPLNVSPSELQEIRSYWKRMSLCLDEINIDDEV